MKSFQFNDKNSTKKIAKLRYWSLGMGLISDSERHVCMSETPLGAFPLVCVPETVWYKPIRKASPFYQWPLGTYGWPYWFQISPLVHDWNWVLLDSREITLFFYCLRSTGEFLPFILLNKFILYSLHSLSYSIIRNLMICFVCSNFDACVKYLKLFTIKINRDTNK